MTNHNLSLAERLRVWKASGLPITLSTFEVAWMSRSLDHMVEDAIKTYEEARKERQRTSWLLTAMVVVASLSWAPRAVEWWLS